MIIKDIISKKNIEYAKYCNPNLDVKQIEPLLEKDHLDLTVSDLKILSFYVLSKHFFWDTPSMFHPAHTLNKIIYRVGWKEKYEKS